MNLSKTDDSVVRIDFTRNEHHSIIWMADAHVDSLDTYRSKIKSLFDSNPDSKIIVGSDFSDMMQNFGDKRASKGKDRYNSPNYINMIVDDLVDFFAPYADRIISFNLGNHEMSAIKYHGINIAQWIAAKLNEKTGTNIQTNDFAGYFNIFFNVSTGEVQKRGKLNYLIYYSHRPISGGARSKGILSSDIVSGRYPDANMYIHEHIHQTLMHPFSVELVNKAGKRIKENKWFIMMPTMKEEDLGVMNAHHHQRNYSPTFAAMVRLDFEIYKYDGYELRCNPNYIYV